LQAQSKWEIVIGGFLVVCKNRARWESVIEGFLEGLQG
jgi:hypothetical protein